MSSISTASNFSLSPSPSVSVFSNNEEVLKGLAAFFMGMKVPCLCPPVDKGIAITAGAVN